MSRFDCITVPCWLGPAPVKWCCHKDRGNSDSSTVRCSNLICTFARQMKQLLPSSFHPKVQSVVVGCNEVWQCTTGLSRKSDLSVFNNMVLLEIAVDAAGPMSAMAHRSRLEILRCRLELISHWPTLGLKFKALRTNCTNCTWLEAKLSKHQRVFQIQEMKNKPQHLELSIFGATSIVD